MHRDDNKTRQYVFLAVGATVTTGKIHLLAVGRGHLPLWRSAWVADWIFLWLRKTLELDGGIQLSHIKAVSRQVSAKGIWELDSRHESGASPWSLDPLHLHPPTPSISHHKKRPILLSVCWGDKYTWIRQFTPHLTMANYLSALCRRTTITQKYTHKSIFKGVGEMVCVHACCGVLCCMYSMLDEADSIQCAALELVIREESDFIQCGTQGRMWLWNHLDSCLWGGKQSKLLPMLNNAVCQQLFSPSSPSNRGLAPQLF